jgi:ABC-type transport system substrate-binding protein
MGWNNPDITRLADMGKAETDPAKRYKIYREFSEIFAVDGPFAPIAQETSQFAFRKNIHGWDNNPDYYGMDFSVLYIE